MYKLSKYHVATEPILDDHDRQLKRVVLATRTAQVRLIREDLWGRLVEGDTDHINPVDRADLVQAEVLVPEGEQELKSVIGRNAEAVRSDDMLSLVVMPTASCQLGCGYCGQEHKSRWLNPQHQAQFLAMANSRLSQKKFAHLNVRWFGGEPLSGLGVIRSLSPRLIELAQTHECTYLARIVTNGLALTRNLAEELVHKHRIRIIDITLDGPPEYHDNRRHQKNGKPTFDRIFRNLVALASSDLDVQIRVRTNVDSSNYHGVVPLLRLMAAEGIQSRIQYYVAPIHSWGNDADDASLSPEDFAAKEIEWMLEMLQLGFRPSLLPSITRIVCMAVQQDSLLIDAEGTLFNCTEVPLVPAYGTPNRYSIGRVENGEYLGKRNLLADFNHHVAANRYPCSSCRMLPVCGGACPKAWLEGDSPCPSTLHNIRDRLLLTAALVHPTLRVRDLKGGLWSEALKNSDPTFLGPLR